MIASDRSRFGQPEIRLGVFPPVAAVILPQQVGIKKAVELTALGTTIDAAEALRIGLLNAEAGLRQVSNGARLYL